MKSMNGMRWRAAVVGMFAPPKYTCWKPAAQSDGVGPLGERAHNWGWCPCEEAHELPGPRTQ